MRMSEPCSRPRPRVSGWCEMGEGSADQSARLWCLETGACLVQYRGHSGSVNCVAISPRGVNDSNDLTVATASGDQVRVCHTFACRVQTSHIWRASLSHCAIATTSLAGVNASSEDELEGVITSDRDDNEGLPLALALSMHESRRDPGERRRPGRRDPHTACALDRPHGRRGRHRLAQWRRPHRAHLRRREGRDLERAHGC